MKRIPLLFIWLFAFIFVNCITVSAADIKIGVIDTQKFSMKSQKITKYRADFNTELENKRQTFTKKQEEAQALENELKAKASTFTYEVARQKNDELQKKAKELQRMKDELEAELQAADAELNRKLVREVREAASEYLKKEKFSLILEKGVTIASDDAIDITDQVIKLFDSKP